jgi:hypothetical protein
VKTLGDMIAIVKEESPLTLAKETVWRAARRWRHYRCNRLLENPNPSVRIRLAPYYQPIISEVSNEQRQILVQLAEGLSRGRIPFLSYETQALGLSPPWNKDFVSGKEWPEEPSHLLAAFRFDGSDVKVPWELSRLQFLPVLGKAYCLTRKDIYRKTALDFVDDWIRRNPVGHGVNWMSPLEAALRALSILLLLNLLAPFADKEMPWLARVTRSLWQHLLYIEGHLEFSHIAVGNHYLSNLVGLYGLAVFLDGPGMLLRRQRYRRILEQEILVHVYEDGGHYEASTGYHVLVTQIFLTTYLLMRADGVMPTASFIDRLRKMFDWMASLADATGRLPHVGDCDDGRVEFLFDDLKQMVALPPNARDSLRVSSLLGLANILWKAGSAGCAAEAPWYGLKSGDWDADKGKSSRASELRKLVLPQSGVALAGWGKNDLLFLAVPNGIHGKGTHTHNDKLSVIFRMNGDEVLCDPGTGCYTRDRTTRDRFRSTGTHNTIIVDGKEQNRIPAKRMGFFMMGNEARVGEIHCESAPSSCRLWAAHSGYGDKGIIHRRAVEWIGVNQVHIEDHFSGSGQHRLEACFHIGPGWKVAALTAEGGGVRCVLEGTSRVALMFRAEALVRFTQGPADASRIYGTMVPSSMVRMSLCDDLPAVLTTDLSWEE